MKNFLYFISLVSLTYSFNLNDNLLGRTFDGIGAISGGGATSRLLYDYNDTYRSIILDYLFKPQYGANLHFLKVEIGGDADTTCGSEHSHMHTADDLSFTRGYEWWLMQEAVKRNSNILLGALQWAVPNWIDTSSSTIYTDLGVDYIIKWITGAKQVYNLSVTYIGGGWNEKYYNTTYIKLLRNKLNEAGFSKYQIVGVDEWGNGNQFDIVNDMLKDTELYNAVDIIGVHVTGPLESTPGTNDHGITPPQAITLEKPLWQSEEHLGLPDPSPAQCWSWEGARTWAIEINQNYLRSNFTSTHLWPITYSWYQGIAYGGKGLLQANTPWSNCYSIDTPVWITAHTTQFTLPGWIYLSGEGSMLLSDVNISYVTLIPPPNPNNLIKKTLENKIIRNTVTSAQTGDFSLIIESMLASNTQLPDTITFTLQGNLKIWSSQNLSLWVTTGPNVVFQKMNDIPVSDQASFTISISPGVIYTITSTTGQTKGISTNSPFNTNFPFPYSDNFNIYLNDTLPKYFSDMQGTFSAYDIGNNNKVLRQQSIGKPVVWGSTDVSKFLTIIGSAAWTDVTLLVNVLIEQYPTTSSNDYFVALGVRLGNLNAFSLNNTAPQDLYKTNAEGYYWKINMTSYELRSGSNILAQGILSTNLKFNTWYKLSLTVKGNINPQIDGFIDGNQILKIADSSSNIRVAGFVGLASGLHHAQFDDFSVS